MAAIRSRRLKLLDAMRRSMSDLLHNRVERVSSEGRPTSPPLDTSAIYGRAVSVAPELLQRLLHVHQLACTERGEVAGALTEVPVDDRERKQMLSAVRAAVHRARGRHRAAQCRA